MPPVPHQARLIVDLPEGHAASTQQGRTVLLEAARKAAQNAYAPDSNFYVGAALQAKSGKVYAGNNTENGNYEGITCGERGAIMDAITHGEALNGRQFIEALAVSCLKAPSLYRSVSGTEESRDTVQKIEKRLLRDPKASFASLAPQWLAHPLVIADLSSSSPCGACRQVTKEFSDQGTVVIIDDSRDGILYRLDDLLPIGFCFGFDSNPGQALLVPCDVELQESLAGRDTSPENLIRVAAAVAENSYAWGGFRRNGAVIITTGGDAVCGASAVNSSTGLSINALRAVMTRATQKGLTRDFGKAVIDKVAVSFIDPPQNGRGEMARALQMDILQEFGHADTEIILRSEGRTAVCRLADLTNNLRPF